ncbi:unnamed protein product [Discosporangium mesarthrocarpum]
MGYSGGWGEEGGDRDNASGAGGGNNQRGGGGLTKGRSRGGAGAGAGAGAGNGEKGGDEEGSTAKAKKLAEMFSPPYNLMFRGSKQERKWLLVNIQANGEFDSHRLNRDVWKDETVSAWVHCNCVFWQEQSVAEEAKLYCRRYFVDSFPHLALIYPRTGLLMWNHTGFLDSATLIQKMTDVTDRTSMEEGAPAPRMPPPPMPPPPPSQVSGSEDAHLAAAIAASLASPDTARVVGGEGEGDEQGEGRASKGKGKGKGKERVGSGAWERGMSSSSSSVIDSDRQHAQECLPKCSQNSPVAESPSSYASTVSKRSSENRSRSRNNMSAASRLPCKLCLKIGCSTPWQDTLKRFPSDFSFLRCTPVGQTSLACGTPAVIASISAYEKPSNPLQPPSCPKDSLAGSNAKEVVGEGEAHDDVVGEELEEEPGNMDPAKTHVRFQLPTGEKRLRKFRKTLAVSQLYLFAKASVEGAQERPFDLRSLRPSASLRDKKGISIEEAQLSNSNVMVVWED